MLLHLARRLADLTGLLSLISRPQRLRPLLRAIRLVVSGDRLLVLLVKAPATTTSLNLRLTRGMERELPILERWTNAQLRSSPGEPIAWHRLPEELRLSGGLLRQALESHELLLDGENDDIVAAGLGGLLGQPEFSLHLHPASPGAAGGEWAPEDSRSPR